MAESIVKVPSTVSGDYDFLGFSFAGKHSWDDFGLIRTSDGDRYNENLAPTMNDKTAEVPGGDGMYFFGSTHKQKDFNVSFAFENMTEAKFAEMKKWLNGKEMGDLWFEEAPYKVYTAKVSGTPSLKYIPFTVDGQRVYKGEGTIQFTAYWPYAHTPDFISQNLFQLTAGEDFSIGKDIILNAISVENLPEGATLTFKKGDNVYAYVASTGSFKDGDADISQITVNMINCNQDAKIYIKDKTTGIPISYYRSGKDLSSYNFSNKTQWALVSSLTNNENVCMGENPGQLPAHFIFSANTLFMTDQGNKGFKVQVDDYYIEVAAKDNPLSNIHWDSKTGLLYTINDNNKKIAIPYVGNGIGAIPVGGTNTIEISLYDADKKEYVEWVKVDSGVWKIYNFTNKVWIDGSAAAKTAELSLAYHYWYY